MVDVGSSTVALEVMEDKWCGGLWIEVFGGKCVVDEEREDFTLRE